MLNWDSKLGLKVLNIQSSDFLGLWEENSGEVGIISAAICRRRSILKCALTWARSHMIKGQKYREKLANFFFYKKNEKREKIILFEYIAKDNQQLKLTEIFLIGSDLL